MLHVGQPKRDSLAYLRDFLSYRNGTEAGAIPKPSAASATRG